jgi:hypothetical protein
VKEVSFKQLLARFTTLVQFSLEKELSVSDGQHADEKSSCCKEANEMQKQIMHSLWYFICV